MNRGLALVVTGFVVVACNYFGVFGGASALVFAAGSLMITAGVVLCVAALVRGSA